MGIYTGNDRWTVSRRSIDCLSKLVPPELRYYFPRFEYEVLDVGRYQLSDEQLEDQNNFMVPLIQLEKKANNFSDVSQIIERFRTQLADPSYDSLRRSIMLYLRYSLDLEKKLPDINPDNFDLMEDHSMLRDRLQKYENSLVEQGISQGIRQGIGKGVDKGMDKVVIGLLNQGVDEEVILNASNFSPEKLNKMRKQCALEYVE